MKNKIKFRRYVYISISIILVVLCLSIIINYLEYRRYNLNYNNKIEMIVTKIKEKYPDITSDEIIEILNSNKNESSGVFKQYGIEDNAPILQENNKSFHKFIIVDIIFIALSLVTLFVVFVIYNLKQEKK